jgi:hypothetical protein
MDIKKLFKEMNRNISEETNGYPLVLPHSKRHKDKPIQGRRQTDSGDDS